VTGMKTKTKTEAPKKPIPMIPFATIERREIYDEFGFPKSPLAEDGYDINGWPVCRIVGVIVDDEVIKTVREIRR